MLHKKTVSKKAAKNSTTIKELGLYAHVPYCLSKCPYCDFSSVAAPHPLPAYMDALAQELDIVRNNFPSIDKKTKLLTIYFGGGTPSVMPPGKIESFITHACRLFTPAKNIEKTLEANPDTLTKDKLSDFLQAGITRLSIGAQSFSDKGLKSLGRRHDAKTTVRAYTLARKAGFTNISLDLMFALPGQTMKDWEKDLKTAIKLSPEHISMYGLTLEPHVRMHKDVESGKIILPQEELQARMYEIAVEVLGKHGFKRYEISNFARKGFESRHNTLYWTGTPYIGLGSSAHSYLPITQWGCRRWNKKDIESYMEDVRAGRLPIEGSEELTKEEAAMETLFTGLRLRQGIAIKDFEKRLSMRIEQIIDTPYLLSVGLLTVKRGRLMLTDKGVLLSNEVFSSMPKKN